MVKNQQRRKRRVFTPEFRAEAVRLCKVGDRTIAQVSKDLDLTENSKRCVAITGSSVALSNTSPVIASSPTGSLAASATSRKVATSSSKMASCSAGCANR